MGAAALRTGQDEAKVTGRSGWGRRRALSPGLAVLVLAILFSCFTSAPRAQEIAGSAAGSAVLIRIEGAIGPASADYLERSLEKATERQAKVVILQIDTPGGLSSSMRDMIRAILASPIPVITYVAPSGARAASAGTYILYASHVAAMAPGTNVGAATPVQMGGGGLLPSGGEDEEKDGENAPSDATSRKAMNDAIAYIRSLAELRGRNVEWAEEAVRGAASLSASAALEEGVIDLIAADVDELLSKTGGRRVEVGGSQAMLATEGLPVIAIEPDLRTRLLGAITDPNIAYILMLIGIYGIIFEFWNPGTVFSGVIGAIALVVGLFALNLLPINMAGAGLLLLGIALMIAEAFAPSFGILGIGGAIAFALGSLFMFEEAPGFELSLGVIVTATAVSAAFFVIALTAIVRAHRLHIVAGDPSLLGATGSVLSWSGSSGAVHVHGERWKARASAPLQPGTPVRVTGRDKLVLIVQPETSPEA